MSKSTASKKFTLTDMEKIITEGADRINRGEDPFTLLMADLVNPVLDGVYLNDNDLEAAYLIEARFFTFMSGSRKLKLDTPKKVVSFIMRLLLLEAKITEVYNSHIADGKKLEEDITLGKNLHKVDVQELETKYIFQSAEDDYTLKIIVHKERGYREALIDDEFLYTRAGPLLVTDIFLLVKVIQQGAESILNAEDHKPYSDVVTEATTD